MLLSFGYAAFKVSFSCSRSVQPLHELSKLHIPLLPHDNSRDEQYTHTSTYIYILFPIVDPYFLHFLHFTDTHSDTHHVIE